MIRFLMIITAFFITTKPRNLVEMIRIKFYLKLTSNRIKTHILLSDL